MLVDVSLLVADEGSEFVLADEMSLLVLELPDELSLPDDESSDSWRNRLSPDLLPAWQQANARLPSTPHPTRILQASWLPFYM